MSQTPATVVSILKKLIPWYAKAESAHRGNIYLSLSGFKRSLRANLRVRIDSRVLWSDSDCV